MGTRLIIPNADFSKNKITEETIWYTNLIDISSINEQTFFANSLIGEGEFPGFGANWSKLGFNSIYGKPINRLKIYSMETPNKQLQTLASKGYKLAIYKAKLLKSWDELDTWGNFPVYSTADISIEKIEDINPEDLLYSLNSNGHYECDYKLSNIFTLNNNTEFVSLGSPNIEGSYTYLLPYNGIDVPIEALDTNPSLYFGLSGETSRNAGIVKCIYIPAIDLGYVE